MDAEHPSAQTEQPDHRPSRSIVALSGGMLLAASTLCFAMNDVAWRSRNVERINPLVLTALVALAELCVVHVYLRRETHTYSLREVPFVVGLLLATPGTLLVAYVVGAVAVLIIRARQSGLKLLFNASLLVFEAVVGTCTFLAIAGNPELQSPRTWFAAAIAALVLDAIGGLMVTVVIALHGGGGEAGAVGWLMLTGGVAAATNASFALVAVIAMSFSPAAAILLACLGATLFVAYRSYASLRRHYSHLLLLRGYTETLGSAIAFEDVAIAAVQKARELLEGEYAELWFSRSSEQDRVLHLVARGDDLTVEQQPVRCTAALLSSHLGARAHSVIVKRGARDATSRTLLAQHGCNDLVAAALRTDRGIVGAILVGDRLGDVATFHSDDSRLLETLADYASIALQNGRLVDELQLEADTREHEALHDSLTGLPNRRGFVERAGLTATECASGFAVLLMDLDHFKDVNDTFGHPSGDELLVEVAQRLDQVTRAPDSVARLGGDEFAIVITGVDTLDAAKLAAERLHAAVAQPYEVSGVSVQVDASIGVALSSQHGYDVDTLLRCADIAMYAAKDQRSNYRVYDPMDDHHTPERLALATELKRAIENEGIALGYQPTKDLATGSIVGVEALARWEHPTRGTLPPPTYIAVAEQTGLIQQLTSYVLRTALAQRAAWARRGVDLRVSVNVSVNDLEKPGFVNEAVQFVHDTETPPGRLTLEITETQALGRPERIAGVLHALRAAGIEVAIDDFGTGYSSLTSLRSLPLDEVKIDSSFIRDMNVNHHDDAIVRSMIELARRLNLRIVAEGVETLETEQTLRQLGCNVVQGYLISRALLPDDFERWLGIREEMKPTGVSGALALVAPASCA